MLAVDPGLFAEIHGSTDTEVVFHLALTLGLENDPVAALERTVGVIESAAEARGVRAPCRRPSGSRTERVCGLSVRDRGPRAVAVRVGRRGDPPPAVPRQPAL